MALAIHSNRTGAIVGMAAGEKVAGITFAFMQMAFNRILDFSNGPDVYPGSLFTFYTHIEDWHKCCPVNTPSYERHSSFYSINPVLELFVCHVSFNSKRI
jgi:hypothetical protein